MMDVKEFADGTLRLIDGVVLVHPATGKCAVLVRDYVPEMDYQFPKQTPATAESYLEGLWGSTWESSRPRTPRSVHRLKKAWRTHAA